MSAEVCASCDPTPYSGRWDETWCIHGVVFGSCGHEYCGGACEYIGPCECACHSAADRPEKERQA